MTLISTWPGFTVKTRQQPFEACVATRTNVTPIGSVVDPGDGSGSSSIGVEVQAGSDTDITKQKIVHRRIRSMPTNPRAAARYAAPFSDGGLVVRRGL